MHLPYVLQSLLLLGKIHALMFLTSKSWFLLQEPYCSSIAVYGHLSPFLEKLDIFMRAQMDHEQLEVCCSVHCLPGYPCQKQ